MTIATTIIGGEYVVFNLELVSSFDAELVRDRCFRQLGYDFSDTACSLTFAVSSNHAARAARNPNVVGVIATREAAPLVPPDRGLAVATDPRSTFYRLNEFISRSLEPANQKVTSHGAEVDLRAYVEDGADVAGGTHIGPFAYVHSNVSIGHNCLVSAGAQIGGDGILYSGLGVDRRRIRHFGSVSIGSGSILQPNCVVARAVLFSHVTWIGAGVVLGANAVVGHDAMVEDSAVISNGCVVARGARIGSGAFLGSGVVVREYVSIGPGARVLAGSVVVQNVQAGATVSGNFAENHVARIRRYHKSGMP